MSVESNARASLASLNWWSPRSSAITGLPCDDKTRLLMSEVSGKPVNADSSRWS